MKKERGLALAACAALAALMLLFASQCSPLYPINLWDDANCLLTVGRVMRRGGSPFSTVICTLPVISLSTMKAILLLLRMFSTKPQTLISSAPRT